MASKKKPVQKSSNQKNSAQKNGAKNQTIPEREHLAALDLGSNSFHLVVASYKHGRLTTVDKIKEMVRLADGLDSNGEIVDAAMDRAVACLTRFGQRLRELPKENVRVVGTNTLRRAKNSSKFLKRAQKALNHKIEIISGAEEARMIFMGVSSALDDSHKHRLVLDIGGGSTELILGKRFKPNLMDSLHMGCVSLSARYFDNGELSRKNYDRALNKARQELESVQAGYRKQGWDTAIGASGTMNATQSVLDETGLSHQGITLKSVEALRDLMLEQSKLEHLDLPGLNKDRSPVFPGGLAIIHALLEELKIERLRVSDGALREGLLFDMVGRAQHDDIRQHTVADLIGRYRIDPEQAARVRTTAGEFLAQAKKDWELRGAELRNSLLWAAELHEIGLDISHSSYQKHGAYLLEHMDMPGFSRLDQTRLATLVRLHRRKLALAELPPLEEPDTEDLLRLTVLLRLAHVLHRSRNPQALPGCSLKVADTSLDLTLPKDWLDTHSLTQLDLAEEAAYLESVGITLTVSVS